MNEDLPKGRKFNEMTAEERAACGRVGGKRSGESRRKKRAMRETLEILLSLPMNAGKKAEIDRIKNFRDIKGKNIDVETALMVQMIQKALKGDTYAAAFIRDTSGQKPQEDVSVNGSIPVVIAGSSKLQD